MSPIPVRQSAKDRFVAALQSLARGGGSIIDAEECARLVDEMIYESVTDHEQDQHNDTGEK